MPGPQVDELVRMLRKELPGTADLGAAVEAMRRRLDVIAPGTAARLSEEIAEAHHVVASQFADIEVLHRHSVIRQRPPWYFGPTHGDLHWPAFEDYLIEAKRWAADDVKAIDDASKEVVSLLSDPNQDQFSCRGLVVGHVQSGKTANMTAVIAKALDAGYDTVVVLSGMTNKLRYQTQLRLVNDLVRRNPRSWQVHTPNEIDGDFRAPPYGGLLQHSDKSQLAVIKKNVSPLRELKKAVDKTYLKVLRGLRILVIDDECDQASVNSARRELDMTAINGRIRELLSCLPAVTYVGYTATPFANVLINPYRADGEELDDLYPRDFITALPKSERYFGAEELFGTMPSDPALVRPHEEAVDMIRNVPPEEEIRLQPRSQRGRDRFRPVMTESLETAILYFLVCCAARHVRGDNRQHMTMLVHTSAYVVAHERMAALIQGWLEVNGARITDGASDLAERIRNIWIEEQNRLPSSITAAARISADQLFECLPLVLDRIEVPIENGASEDRIDYGGEAKTYIVVGGSILARGLTLEGLMVSYFLRKANQYDTLLQMGRWFGYRPGYEDLPRIWMPEDLRLRFRALAVVEAEIRDEIEQYHKQNLTPEDIAVRIRAIPGMAITGVNKMRHARPCAVSYWGTHRQTFRFDHRDRELLRRNWEAGVDLINLSDSLKLRDRRAARTGRKLWRGVPVSTIRRFFERYAVHRHHRDLAADMLLPFLASGDPRLAKWNVGVVEAKGGRECPSPLGDAGRVKAVKRARMADSTSVADIKALMSKRDVLFDVDKEQSTEFAGWADLKAARAQAVGDVPLLLLYPIDRESAPQRSGGVRTSLDAAFDVLGYGIIFPGSVTEGGDYVSVELSPFSADELDAIDAEEAAQAEAAGVEGSRG